MIDSVIIGYYKSSGDILMIPEDIEIKSGARLWTGSLYF